MRNKKIKFGLVFVMFAVLPTLLAAPVSAQGSCPDSFILFGPGDRMPVGNGPGDLNGNGYVCVKFLDSQFGGNTVIIDDVIPSNHY